VKFLFYPVSSKFWQKLIFLGSCLYLTSNSPARALVTYPLQYSDSGSMTLSGSITIDETNPEAQQSNTFLVMPSWVTSLTISFFDGSSTTNFSKSDYAAIRWVPNNPSNVDYSADLLPQFTNINFIAIDSDTTPDDSGTPNEMNMTTGEFTLQSTPGPLPILGFIPFITYSRKIKRKIQFHKEITATI